MVVKTHTRRRVAALAERPRRVAHLHSDEERVRCAGGPEDAATYNCDCGSTFKAVVSAEVSCPSCGHSQAW